MKITIALGSSRFDQKSQTAIQYATQLTQLDHDVSLIAPPAIAEPIGRMRRIFKRSRTVEPNIAEFTDLPFAQVTGLNLHDELPDADILLATSCSSAHWIAPLEGSKGVPVHFVQSYELVGEDLSPYMPSTYQLPMQTLAVSHWLAQLLTLRHKTQVKDVVPLGITPADLPARSQPTRPTIGLRIDEVVMSNFSTVAKALATLREKLPTMQLLIYGTPQRLKRFGLPPDTLVYDSQGDVSLEQVQAECDVWLYCHPTQPFATDIVRSLAAGTPVVAVTAGDAQIILADGGGLLVPIDDANAMSTALYEVCTLAEKNWNKVSRLAVKLSKQYHWDAIGRKLQFTLYDCIENAAKAP